MRGPLPVYVDDPVARLRVVREAMDGLKESKQAVGAEVLASVQNFAPPTILAQAARHQLLDAAVQPDRHQRPRARSSRSTCAGARCSTSSPSRSCPRTTRWPSRSCPTTGGMNFGLLGDFDALPDIESIGDGIERVARRARRAGAQGAAQRRAVTAAAPAVSA